MVGTKAWVSVRRASASRVGWLLCGAALACACGGRSSRDVTGDASDDICPRTCEAGKRCPGAPTVDQDCATICFGQDLAAEETGCNAEYKASLACSATLSDVCTGPTACKAELNAWYQCEHKFCLAHPDDLACIGMQ